MVRILRISLILLALLSTAANAQDGDFQFTADGRVQRNATGRALRWETAGRVFALDKTSAEKQANEVVDEFLKTNYPQWTEVPGSRRMSLGPTRNTGANAHHTTLRMHVTCLGAIVRDKPVLTIMTWDIITEEEVIDRFTLRIIVIKDGEERVHEGEVVTIGRGKEGEFGRWFDVWSGDFVEGDLEPVFTFRVLQKDVPEVGPYVAPKVPNPADPNDGFTEVGTFRVRLRHEVQKLVADWERESNVTTPSRPRPGPGLLSQRFIVEAPETVPFGISVYAEKKADADAEREKALEAARAKDEQMRKKLDAAGRDIKVYTGSVEGTDGGSRVGVGALVVASANVPAAEEYLAREFPGQRERGTAIAVSSEEEAKKFLIERFKASFPNGQPGEPRLTVKTRRTMLDRLQEVPGRRRR